MSQEQNMKGQNSSPGAESPDMTPQQTGQSAQTSVEGGSDDSAPSSEPTGQSSDAPATG